MVIFVRHQISIVHFGRFADQVTIGDQLLVEASGEFVSARVINISSDLLQGYYLF